MTFQHKIIEIAKKADKDGFVRNQTGNYSIFDRENGIIYITPTGFERETLKQEDIVMMSPSGKILYSLRGTKPSREVGMHLAVYASREDVNAIVHTHSTYATAFAVKGRVIDPITTESSIYGGQVGMVPPAPVGSVKLATGAAQALKDKDACLLQNHGVITIGKTIDEAYLKAVYVEETAKIQYISERL